MNLTDCLLLSVALGMDCFSISVTCGIIEKRFHASQALTMALLFGAFQALMPLVGWLASSAFYSLIESVAPLIAFALLLFIGAKMIWESLHAEGDRTFNPNRLLTLLYLAVATSIDALAVGISFTCVGMNSLKAVGIPLIIIAAGSFLLSLVGKGIGAYVGKKLHFNAELLGGIVLILLGLKILIAG